MKPDDYLLYFSCSLIFGYLAVSIPAQAQIASDNSMSVPTQVMRQSDKLFEIIGGTEAGSNLFHSFAEFSVSEENIARFINNNPTIQNVINRVTGVSASEIFGKIEVGGSAPNFNLFLLNPNGIIFGPNASLDLKGSFIATTANAIQFGDRGFFSASSPNEPSLLTVQPSAFFFNQVRPNSIRNQSRHQTETVSGDPVSVGLQVPNDKSLLLLGGDVTIDGGMLTAHNGRVQLGGLAETGTVTLNTDGNNLALSFPDGVVQADVLLNNGAKVDVTDRGSGSITINARNIEIARGSKLTSGILKKLVSSGGKAGEITLKATGQVMIDNNSEIGSKVNQEAIGNSGDIYLEAESLQLVNGAFIFTLANGKGNSGNIIINIRDNITLKGRSNDINSFQSQIANQVLQDGEGKGGNIIINAKSLSLADAASIQTATIGEGNAGNILVRVDEFISLENTNRIQDQQITQIRTVVEAGAIGNGGTIDLQARSLSLTGGSQLAASVFRGSPGGSGKGGDVIVNTSDSVNISGVGLDGFSSGIFASTERGAMGLAGNITVNTDFFRISDGGVITAETENSGRGGNIRIIANTFEAINGGQLITIAESSGNAGSITISAGDRVTLSGSNPTFVSEVGSGSGLFARSDSSAAGNVTINTPQLRVQEGAKVTVSSPQGQAGNLTINAKSLFLNQGSITAQTGKSGGEEGANITLKISDLFRIENESLISATANGSANGGNITINNNPFIVAFPDENSDITANASEGRGGNINITAQGIFGIEERKESKGNRTNDIDASSEFGLSGVVEINQPDVDPNRGLVELPETVVDPNALVAQNPCKRGSESEFVITGRGGLPPSLNEDLSSDATQVGLVEPAPIEVREQGSKGVGERISSSSLVPTTIIPAQGWVFNERGEVVLVAYDPTVTGSQRLKENQAACPMP